MALFSIASSIPLQTTQSFWLLTVVLALLNNNISIVIHTDLIFLQSNLRLQPPRKQPPLLSDQFSKIPKVSLSNHYNFIWNFL